MPTIIVSSGVVSSGLTVDAGEALQVLGGGEVIVATVLSGGAITLASGALASAVFVSAGGAISGTGEIEGSNYVAGVVENVSVGGPPYASGGLEVLSGGSAIAVVVENGSLTIDAGGVASSTQLVGGNYYGASLTVNGKSYSALVGARTDVNVSSGGLTFGDQIASGGLETVYSGGSANGTIISSGATEIVAFGGLISGATISSGGVLSLSSGAIDWP